jgi:hypothetical protein
MENSTLTIEIKQEVSVFLIWIVAGVLLVAMAFFLPPASNELWPQLYSGCIAAIVYLLALLVFIVRQPVSTLACAAASAAVLFTAGCLLFSLVQSDSNAHWQTNTMIEIRSRIGRGTMSYYTTEHLLKTLQAYYQQGSQKKETLAQVFQRQNDHPIVGSNIHKPYNDGDSLKTYVQTLESDKIILVSQEVYVKGKNPRFKNYNGLEGMIQEKCTLTAKGIVYESEN